MLLRLTLVTVAVLVGVPSSAVALTIVEPTDGAEVGSRPAFILDAVPPTSSSLSVEVSRSPDLQTAGRSAGKFVDPVDSDVMFFGDDPPLDANTVQWGPSRLDAGTYYWHGLIETYDGQPSAWSPMRRFTVADEPPIFTGWTLRAERLRKRGRPSPCSRVRLRGVIRFEDNATAPEVIATIRVKAGSRTVAQAMTTLTYGSGKFDLITCPRATRLTVSVRLEDEGGNVVRGPVRTTRV